MVAPVRSWDRWPDNARQVFQALRSEAGEDMVLKNNFFVGKWQNGEIFGAQFLPGILDANLYKNKQTNNKQTN